nr:hypothetical protein [uncultured Sulfurimonas sp.]
MKSILGRVILSILIFLNLELLASTYKWSAQANKHEAMVNEAIHLKYICEYSDKAQLYVIEFSPMTENEKYTIELLSENEKILNGKKINTFEFVAFVKEAGKISFSFDTTMKKTNKDSIQNTVLGRDNADYEEFTKRYIRQKEVVVEIKPTISEIAGEFVLSVKQDKQSIKAYEPYHLEVKIEGNGNFKDLKPIKFNIDGVKVFSQKVIEDIKLTKDGYVGSWNQKFAFVSENDFNISQVEIKYFDLITKKENKLIIKETKINVEKAYKKDELLDKEKKSFEFNYDFIYYLLTFISGFLFAKINFNTKRKLNSQDASFKAKVKNAESLEELMIILVLQDARKYEKLILEIESKNVTSLNKCKKTLIHFN